MKVLISVKDSLSCLVSSLSVSNFGTCSAHSKPQPSRYQDGSYWWGTGNISDLSRCTSGNSPLVSQHFKESFAAFTPRPHFLWHQMYRAKISLLSWTLCFVFFCQHCYLRTISSSLLTIGPQLTPSVYFWCMTAGIALAPGSPSVFQAIYCMGGNTWDCICPRTISN